MDNDTKLINMTLFLKLFGRVVVKEYNKYPYIYLPFKPYMKKLKKLLNEEN